MAEVLTVPVDAEPFTLATAQGAKPSRSWRMFFSRLAYNVSALVSYGPTTSRPTEDVRPGQPFFDTTLALPIWRNAGNTGWIDALGNPV